MNKTTAHRTTARVGAAAFVLGLSLSVPPAVAVAEDGSGDPDHSPTAAAESGEPRQRPTIPALRGGRSETRVTVRPEALDVEPEPDAPVAGAANTTAVVSVTGAAGRSSSVTVTNWDQWQVSDILQVIRPSQGRWNLDVWTDIQRDPVVAASPANEIPLSVL